MANLSEEQVTTQLAVGIWSVCVCVCERERETEPLPVESDAISR